MEFALGRSDHESRVKEEKTSESAGYGDEDHRKQEIDVEVPPVGDTSGPIASSTKQEEVEELESAKTEMGEVREENQRLKQCLDRVMKDYKTLEMQFRDIVQKETKEPITYECDELVSLSLGRVIRSNDNNARNNDDHQKSKALKALLLKKDDDEGEELALGLKCKFETSKSSGTSINTNHDEANNNNNNNMPHRINNASPSNSSHHEEELPMNNESKSLKTSRDGYCGEDEVSEHSPAKKARVCVRARCDAQTMNDGCQWRKYGQKISKGNPCPRAYYRCTVAPSCPVKKQVQRCAEDMSVLVTTYEGMHNHPLPLSATAMASTTSAAASMLLSGSSSTTTSSSADLYGLNFSISDGSSMIRSSSSSSKPLLYHNLPNYHSSSLTSSMPTSHPTITLDLTTNPLASTFITSSSSSSTNFNQPPPRSSSLYPSSSTSTLNFSVPNKHHFLSHSTQNNNRNNIFSSMNLARSTTIIDNVYKMPPYLQKNPTLPPRVPPPTQPADSIAAATKAITADPKFQSALAVALTSIIGTASGGAADNLPHHKMKWGELFPAL